MGVYSVGGAIPLAGGGGGGGGGSALNSSGISSINIPLMIFWLLTTMPKKNIKSSVDSRVTGSYRHHRMSAVIKISDNAYQELCDLQAEYVKRCGLHIDLKSLASLTIIHGMDSVRAKLNITKPNEKRNSRRNQSGKENLQQR